MGRRFSPQSALDGLLKPLFILILAVHAADATPFRISLELAGAPRAGAPILGTLKLVPQSPKGTERTLDLPVQLPGERQVDLQPDVAWQARFEAKGFWSETLTVLPQSAGSANRLRVFPAGKVHAKVVMAMDEKPLKSLALRLQSSFASQKEPLNATIACPVERGTLACEVPAGKVDLRLRAEGGFAPVYLWDVEIAPGKDRDLGELRLKRGASVSGWVQTAEGRSPSGECRLKLSLGSASTYDLKVRDQIEKGSLRAQPNAKGFFQIVGVPPGRYELTAIQPGYAETRLSPIDVRPDLESQVIEHLVLARPVTFDITVDPPVEPYGSPWKIELERRADLSEPSAGYLSGKASQEGIWHVPGIAPGTYQISVRGDQKAIWHTEFVDVQPGQPNLRIDLPVLRVEGRLLIGKEPLAATLWLSQKDGRRLRFDSDNRGRFNGVLPGAGLWSPQVFSEKEKLQIFLEPLEIKPPAGKNRAEIEIRLPDTKLVGQVVDEAGQPVPAAHVYAMHMAKPLKQGTDRFESDAKGEFSVRGLPSGSWLVKAEEEDRESDYLSTSLPEQGESPWLRIVIRKLQTFEGRIVSAAGGVPGAMIVAWPPLNGQNAASSAEAVSGADGSFHVDLPSGTQVLNLAVLPPGYAMRLTALPVSPSQPIEIPVESQGGTLILERADGRPSPFLVHGGVYAITHILTNWARMQGVRPTASGRLVLPNVEAGSYSFCRGAGVVSRMTEGGEPPAASCAAGVLAPNGELVLGNPEPTTTGTHR